MMFQTEREAMLHLFKANDFFRKKDYNHSLTHYNKALQAVSQNPSPVHSLILSSRGLNYYSLRDYDRAEADYDAVLASNPFDTTTLNRRATMFLKTKAYSKAATDISRLYELEPESIRVSALSMEIKEKAEEEWKVELRKFHDLEIDDRTTTEEDELNFFHLKKLDRQTAKRVSVKDLPKHNRMSLVEFKEDSRITYEAAYEEPRKPQPRLSKAMISNILQDQKKDLVETGCKENLSQNFKFVENSSKKKHQRSILKCSIMYKVAKDSDNTISNPSSSAPLDVSKVISIDGEIIKSSTEVRFMSKQIVESKTEFNATKLKETVKRKSSLRPPSFQPHRETSFGLAENKIHSPNRPSFLGLKNMDGKMLKKEESEDITEQKDEDSSDSGEQHNIFGDREIPNIDKQLENMFGGHVRASEKNFSEKIPGAKPPKKSILKVSDSPNKHQSPATKSKKSVLFR